MGNRSLNTAVVIVAVFAFCGFGRGAAPATTPSTVPPIAVGDRLHILLKNDGLIPNGQVKSFGANLPVNDDGDVELRGLKAPVHVAGLSPDEAVKAINLAYRQSVPSHEVDATVRVQTPGVVSMPVAVDDNPYSPGDLVHVWVSDLAGSGVPTALDVHVDARGNVPLPLLKDLHIAGLTQDEARRAINRAYHDAELLQYAGAQIRKVKAAGPGVITAGPIEVGDTLKIRLWDLDGPGKETDNDLEVKDEGTISLPHIGPITVIGMTEGQVAHAISKAYRDASLIRNMEVTVLRTTTMAGK